MNAIGHDFHCHIINQINTFYRTFILVLFPFMETGHRTSAFLRRIQDQEYQKCVEYYYENEANGVEPDEELKECYGVAKYYEAAWQRMRYLASGEQVLAKEAEAGMEAAAEEMGELQPVREQIDEILKQGR